MKNNFILTMTPHISYEYLIKIKVGVYLILTILTLFDIIYQGGIYEKFLYTRRTQ
jgi:hypothetical protein